MQIFTSDVIEQKFINSDNSEFSAKTTILSQNEIDKLENLLLCKLSKIPIGELPVSCVTSLEKTIDEIPILKLKINKHYISQDNKIKQKALSLGEDLINFLNDNDIKNCFVEPLVGFINNEVVVINMPLTDEDLFIEELLNRNLIKNIAFFLFAC